ncbi:MAG: polynucleotide kinase-phosphatase [Cyanobacteria bacterium TGS_CYA1]|nr:polynucleotide kinase-phosphatase [Cyanobacteria bacterium TGS_CYA1]
MKINLPELCLVVLVGTSGSGKSTFGKKHFFSTQVISSDYCRGLVSDDENSLEATSDAFEVLHFIAGKRLQAGKLTVIDATNVQAHARKSLIELARKHHVLAACIVLDLPASISQERNKHREDRNFGPHVIRNQQSQLRQSLRFLKDEGFRYVYVLKTQEDVDAVEIGYQPLWNNRKFDHGPFDIIGDVHGCFDELQELLEKLGYSIKTKQNTADSTTHKKYEVVPPDGRRALFLGDLVDRGPKSPDVLKLVMSMVESGAALCVPGNHDIKLMRKLRGRDVKITHGLKETLEQLEHESEEFKRSIDVFMDKLIGHYVLDDGKLVVAHAGMKEEFQGRSSGRIRDFALYGETTGETDEYGLPVRYNWAGEYRGKAMVVYGHTPVPEAEWTNKTICIDTGCVFGGKLTALKYPEKELFSVPAKKVYYEPAKPFLPVAGETDSSAPEQVSEKRSSYDLLDINDVSGKRIINTELLKKITIKEEYSAAALEVMSRFAVDPRWIVYLPPTMSPTETTREPNLLEHPLEAFEYYKKNGIQTVMCQEKHMGSRAVVIVCQNENAAKTAFGIENEGQGICYTRTGRRFFNDLELERKFIAHIAARLEHADFWKEFDTDFVVLDCELMPWSAKAQELLRDQYAAVGASADAALNMVLPVVSMGAKRHPELLELEEKFAMRKVCSDKFRQAYAKYCWNVESMDDLRLAPFHILATSKNVHTDKSHQWHMDAISKFVKDDKILMATNYKNVDLTDETSVRDAIDWWFKLTESGGEGMVVKPENFVARAANSLLQPAVKCRGKEYLRIIYGPEYTLDENLKRLKARGVGAKRSLALREFALGVEALNLFVKKEPLYRVHECVFGVLALESEPVDPRL